MNCASHNNSPAITACSTCSLGMCRECVDRGFTSVEEKPLCPTCAPKYKRNCAAHANKPAKINCSVCGNGICRECMNGDGAYIIPNSVAISDEERGCLCPGCWKDAVKRILSVDREICSEESNRFTRVIIYYMLGIIGLLCYVIPGLIIFGLIGIGDVARRGGKLPESETWGCLLLLMMPFIVLPLSWRDSAYAKKKLAEAIAYAKAHGITEDSDGKPVE